MSDQEENIKQLFREKFKKQQQDKLLEQALIYLRLRENGCPKMKALIFTKKKTQGIDSTIRKDGPAGFRKLIPQKIEGLIKNGWVKGQKLKYKGLRGYSEQINRNICKEKRKITAYNQKDRKNAQFLRIKRLIQNQPLINTVDHKKMLEQISNLKDQLLKDKQKRNLFLSYNGQRLQEYTRQYFQQIDDIDPKSLIMKMAAFNDNLVDDKLKIQTDWQVAKGRSLSSYEMDGEKKRKAITDFRKSLSQFKLPKMAEQNRALNFRKTLHNSQKKTWSQPKNTSGKKKDQANKDIELFNTDIDKLFFIKSKGIHL